MNPVAEKIPHRWYFLNFFAIIAWGVLCLVWLGKHTDFLPLVGNLLGLGGIFAWIAFFMGVVKDERKDQLRDILDKYLSRRATFFWIFFAYIFLFTWANLHGSLRLETRNSGQTHHLRLEPDPGRAREVSLSAGTVRRALFFAGKGHKFVDVKVPGLPRGRFNVDSFKSTKIIIPHHLYRPVILLRPDDQLTRHAFDNALTISIEFKRGGASDWETLVENIPYLGTSLWLGCDDDVAVPRSVARDWKFMLHAKADKRDLVLARWEQVQAPKPEFKPRNNDVYRASIRNEQTQKIISEPGEHVFHLDSSRTKRVFADYTFCIYLKEKQQPDP